MSIRHHVSPRCRSKKGSPPRALIFLSAAWWGDQHPIVSCPCSQHSAYNTASTSLPRPGIEVIRSSRPTELARSLSEVPKNRSESPSTVSAQTSMSSLK